MKDGYLKRRNGKWRWNGVENLCIYMAFFIQYWSLKNMGGILSDFCIQAMYIRIQDEGVD
jgi:hypothetical protein